MILRMAKAGDNALAHIPPRVRGRGVAEQGVLPKAHLRSSRNIGLAAERFDLLVVSGRSVLPYWHS